MTSLESAASQLGVVLVVIYLVDCFRWVARNAAVFRLLPPLAARAGAVWQIAAQFRRALVFGFPVPPFGSIFTAEDWPFVAGPAGIRFVTHDTPLHAAPTSRERFLSWDDCAAVSIRGASLEVDGVCVHTFGSKRAARAILEVLGKLCRAERGQRSSALREALRARCDVPAITERLRSSRLRRRVLAATNSFLFVSLFGLLALLMLSAEYHWWWFLVPAHCWLGAVGATLFTVRRSEPALRPSAGALAITLISPVSLMRSNDLFEPELLADFHPAAVAAALLPAPAARNYIEQRLRAARFEVRGQEALTQGDAAADNEASRKMHQECYRTLLKSLPGSAAPAPQGAHCPRCWVSYTGAASVCDSCPGVELQGRG